MVKVLIKPHRSLKKTVHRIVFVNHSFHVVFEVDFGWELLDMNVLALVEDWLLDTLVCHTLSLDA